MEASADLFLYSSRSLSVMARLITGFPSVRTKMVSARPSKAANKPRSIRLVPPRLGSISIFGLKFLLMFPR